jgi:hypothetical protein
MKTRSYVATLAVAAVAAFGVPAAQAHVVGGNGSFAAAKSAKTQQAWIKTIRMLGRSLPAYAR